MERLCGAVSAGLEICRHMLAQTLKENCRMDFQAECVGSRGVVHPQLAFSDHFREGADAN
jgi:hypothetical protein